MLFTPMMDMSRVKELVTGHMNFKSGQEIVNGHFKQLLKKNYNLFLKLLPKKDLD